MKNKNFLTLCIGLILALSLSLTIFLTALPQKQCTGSDHCADVCNVCRHDYDCYNSNVIHTVCGEKDGMCYSQVAVLCYAIEAHELAPWLPERNFYYKGFAYCEHSDSKCNNK